MYSITKAGLDFYNYVFTFRSSQIFDMSIIAFPCLFLDKSHSCFFILLMF